MPSLLTLSDVMGTGHHAAVTARVAPGRDRCRGRRRRGRHLRRHRGQAAWRRADHYPGPPQGPDRAGAGEFGATDVVSERGEEAIERVRAAHRRLRRPVGARMRRHRSRRWTRRWRSSGPAARSAASGFRIMSHPAPSRCSTRTSSSPAGRRPLAPISTAAPRCHGRPDRAGPRFRPDCGPGRCAGRLPRDERTRGAEGDGAALRPPPLIRRTGSVRAPGLSRRRNSACRILLTPPPPAKGRLRHGHQSLWRPRRRQAARAARHRAPPSPARATSRSRSSIAASAIRTCTPSAPNGAGTLYPCVPGHEIVGRVTAVGGEVTKFKVGDTVGVGCMVDSCRHCHACDDGLEQYCENGFIGTYNGPDAGPPGHTLGGYSQAIVVDEGFVLAIDHPEEQLAAVAPLLCAGITTYSPLRHWQVGPGQEGRRSSASAASATWA